MITTMISADPASAKAHAIALWQIDPETHQAKLVKAAHVEAVTKYPRPEVLVVEEQFAGRNSKSSLGLARSAGHLIARLGHEIDTATLAPLPGWKRALTTSKAPKAKTLDAYAIHTALVDTHLGKRSAHVYRDALDKSLTRDQSRLQDLADAVGLGVWWLLDNDYAIL